MILQLILCTTIIFIIFFMFFNIEGVYQSEVIMNHKKYVSTTVVYKHKSIKVYNDVLDNVNEEHDRIIMQDRLKEAKQYLKNYKANKK